MIGRGSALLLIAIAVGCSRPPSPVARARKYIGGWNNMGMHLPTDQVGFFDAHFAEVKHVLGGALSHSDPDVRQRAAYVVERLGERGAPLGPAVERALRGEPERIVRLYFYDALIALRGAGSETVSHLMQRFDSSAGEKSQATKNECYSAVDERIYLGAALYCLDVRPDRKAEYFQAVLRWLSPPAADLPPEYLEAYWEHRWCAVNALEGMPAATEAIPLLEAMLTEASGKPWVAQQVPRVLQTLGERGTHEPARSMDAAGP